MRRPLALLLSVLMLMSAMLLPQSSGITAQAATFTDKSQSQIVSEMGLGWNLGNQLEANLNGTPSETAWGNPQITSTIFKAIKSAGFSTVRIPVSWLSYIGSGSSYTVDSAWMARVKEVVDLAIAEDLYVVINVHGDGYSSVTGGWLLPGASDQTTIKAKFSALWNQIATTFKDYDHHLIFEGMNEIGADANYDWETVYNYYTNINAYNQLFVDAVRSTGGNNTNRWLIVTGWNTNIDYTVSEWQNFVLPTDNYNSSPRIMVSVHYYSPWEFCGDESYTVTGWGSSSSNNAGWGNEDYMVEQLSAMYNRFVSAGYPVFIGEFGCIDKGNTSSRVYWAETFCQYAKQYGCIPVWWDNGYNGTYGFGLFDRSSGSQTQSSIISAMVNVFGGTSSTTTAATTTTTKATTTATTTTTTKATTTTTTAASTDTGATGLDGYYYIKSKHSNLYLNTAGDSSSNSAAIVHETGDGAMAQRFRLVSTGTSGVYYIYTGASDYTKCVDISGRSSSNGTSVIQYSYNGNNNQQFKLVKVGDYYAILTGVSGYASCLDVYNWSTTAGDPIKQYEYWGGDCQLYKLESCSAGNTSTTTAAATTTTTTKATTTTTKATTTTTTTKATTATTTAASSSNSSNYVITINTTGNGSSLLKYLMVNGYHIAINGTDGTYWENTAVSGSATIYVPKSNAYNLSIDFKSEQWGSALASWSGNISSDITLTFNGSSVTQS